MKEKDPYFLQRFTRLLQVGSVVWGLLVTGSLAASLEIYRDAVKYRYVPVDDYVGFVRGAKAVCGERSISLISREKCPETKRLCKEAKSLDDLRFRLESVRNALTMTDHWVTGSRPGAPDAGTWLAAAEKMGKQTAEWERTQRHLTSELTSRERQFLHQVSDERPRFLSQRCKEELGLTLPPALIDIALINVADLKTETIEVSRYLSLRNHSGVDISSKDLRIYARSFHRKLRPIFFRPLVLRGVAKGSASHSTDRKIRNVEQKYQEASSTRFPIHRDYTLGKIDLPSTGEEIRIRINSYSVPRKCEELSYPWRNATVYLACRFRPERPMESARWIVRSGHRLISENAYGTYEGKDYLLVIDRDESVEVHRRALAGKVRLSGISGGKISKEDGFVLEIVNRSSRQKSLTIIERIPVSTGDLHVKLLKVEGAAHDSLNAEGRLVLRTAVAPGEHKQITVLFELTYPKGLTIRY